MNNKAIELNDVSFSFRAGGNQKKVFESLNFRLDYGDVCGVIGSNGVGKSTLLKLIAGVFPPEKGTVKIATNNISLISLQVGFQGELSGRDNIVLSGMLLGYGLEEVKRVTPEIIGLSGISGSIDLPTRSYSDGMKARLAFAIATFLRAKVLLVDEILGVGDEDFRLKTEKAFNSNLTKDNCVIIVSHDIHQISRLCNKVLYLKSPFEYKIGDAKVICEEYLESV
ncbi:ABC transporter ATP-binding protein [Thalassotalea montiporae]